MNCVADQTLLERFACIDYTGISLLIAASIMTTEYTAFYCEPISRWTYMTATAVLGIAGTILPWHPKFNGQDMAWLRVGFFVGLGATGFMPVFQIVLTRGPAWALDFYAGSNLLKSLFVYVLGACVYASKVPERWFPGAFDYCGNAHNLWHVSINGAPFDCVSANQGCSLPYLAGFFIIMLLCKNSSLAPFSEHKRAARPIKQEPSTGTVT